MYIPHPSAELNALFEAKPYQGVAPDHATFLFVGLDANYDEHIDRSPTFPAIREYHSDGVSFWQRHGVHHPFLLPQYSGDGRRYHRNFARIGFKPEHAPFVSFTELLHVPTVGRSALVPQDLDSGHLHALSAALLNGQARHIFLSAAVARLMQASGAFPWLRPPKEASGPLRVFHTDCLRTVYLHLHLSNYGKFEKQMVLEASAIGALLVRANAELTLNR